VRKIKERLVFGRRKEERKGEEGNKVTARIEAVLLVIDHMGNLVALSYLVYSGIIIIFE
jgi:hypothetical protein